MKHSGASGRRCNTNIQSLTRTHAEPHSFLLTNGRGARIYIVKLEDSERGKGSEGGLGEPWPCSLFLFPAFLCATHCSGFFNLALISCTPDETNTDSFFTFVKAPTAAVPISPHVYESGPDPSWACRERVRDRENERGRIAMGNPPFPPHTMCHVHFNRTGTQTQALAAFISQTLKSKPAQLFALKTALKNNYTEKLFQRVSGRPESH